VLITLFSLGVMGEALRVKTERKLAISLQRGHFDRKFQVEGDALHQSRIVRPYNFVADNFHTKKLCSRLSSSKVRFYTENGRFAFLSPIWGA